MNESNGALFKDKQIGFGIYLGVEVIMFATLFATYLIYTPSPYGPQPDRLFDAKSFIVSSVILLSTSGTLMAAERGNKKRKSWMFLSALAVTLLFAAIFLGLEIKGFYEYMSQGYGMSANNFMASFYVLVGLHAAHVAFGIGWMIALFINWLRHIPSGLYEEKLKIFSYYWHFVDVVWVFIMLLVYLPYLL